MSRYDLKVRSNVDASSASIGWDRPLQTFFAQVRRMEDGEEISFIWEGCDYRELTRPADAICIVEPYCEIPDDLAQRLEIDRMETSGQADGEAQIAAKSLSRDCNAFVQVGVLLTSRAIRRFPITSFSKDDARLKRRSGCARSRAAGPETARGERGKGEDVSDMRFGSIWRSRHEHEHR